MDLLIFFLLFLLVDKGITQYPKRKAFILRSLEHCYTKSIKRTQLCVSSIT